PYRCCAHGHILDQRAQEPYWSTDVLLTPTRAQSAPMPHPASQCAGQSDRCPTTCVDRSDPGAAPTFRLLDAFGSVPRPKATPDLRDRQDIIRIELGLSRAWSQQIYRIATIVKPDIGGQTTCNRSARRK